MKTTDRITNKKAETSSKILEKLNEGGYFILDKFKDKEKLSDLVRQVILSGIEKLEGVECRRLVESDGLCKMHQHFPADKLADLDLFVKGSPCVKEVILQLSFNVGRGSLKLPDEFFMEENPFAFKISYPHQVAVESKVTNADYHQKYSALRNRITLEENLKLRSKQKINYPKKSSIGNLLKIASSLKKSIFEKILSFGRSDQNQLLETYKGFDRIANQPYAAKVHQPHIDSWYGAPLEGISLWWAIEGATENNGVVLYPDFFGQAIDFQVTEASSSYLPFGITLTKPYKIPVPNGNILLFKYDMLHSSHLNISDFTRIAVVAQIYPQLQFNPDAIHARGTGFHSSADIARGDWENLVQAPIEDNFGVLFENKQKPHVERRISVRIKADLLEGIPICLCDSNLLKNGEKMLVTLQSESIIVIRNARGLQAVSAICSHMGVNLIDGFHDEQNIYCPGHAVAYSLADGSSNCEFLKLQVYQVYDHNQKFFEKRTMRF
ncbi:MAG: Rieske 2Fe-2S domain-containing protein [Cyanobacteria bacterium RU_5_0]|nr:Rieske 2Fe-2S domain-containing protein [Cyanobacteria bacterium RU_5_0]